MPIVDEQKEIWSVRETAARLGISERTLYSITSPRGSLKCVRIGTRVFYNPRTVAVWIQEQEEGNAQ